MANQTLTECRQLTRQEIKQFAGSNGPCVTIFLPAEVAGAKQTLPARVKAAAAKAEEKLGELSTVSTVVRKLVDPVAALAGEFDGGAQGQTLAIFAGENETRHYWLPDKLEETIVAADNFYVRPLLKHIEGEREFYLLALSQKDVRLLHCTAHSSEEVDLADRIPHSVLESRQSRQPDHDLDNKSSAGPSMGSGSKGVMFGTGTEKEDRAEFLTHFFQQVNAGVTGVLKGQEKIPLVVCGVEYELALYHSVNTWPRTCPEGVRGAPNGLKGGEMHARALQCLEQMNEAELDEVLAQHNKQAGEAAAAGVNEIVKAAYDGRVLHLIAGENATAMGNFDEAAHRARTHQVPRSGDEDLINAAAAQTIIHGGRVHLVPQARVPGNRPMAAVMRY